MQFPGGLRYRRCLRERARANRSGTRPAAAPDSRAFPTRQRPAPIKAVSRPSVNTIRGLPVAKSGLFVGHRSGYVGARMRSTKIVATIGPASQGSRRARADDRGGHGRGAARTSPTAPRSSTPRRRGDPGGAPSAPGARWRSSATCPGRSCGSARWRAAWPSSPAARSVVLTSEDVEGTSERLPVAWEGFSELVDDGRRALPRRRRRAPARGRGERRRRGDPGRGRRQRRLAPGAQPAERDGLAAGGERRGHRADGRRARDGRRLLRALVRAPARGPRPGARAPALARLGGAADREDREAAGGRQRRGDRGRGRRHHDRPRRPRHRAADRGGAARAEAAAGARGPARQADDHRHPDARVDGALDAAHARRGGRRGERDLRRHRRGDALPGDRGRAATRCWRWR